MIMETNGSGIENTPTRFQRALGVISTVVATLGLVGLVLVSGSLILGESLNQLGFWTAHIFIALFCALLIYAGYRIASYAQRAQRSSGEAPTAAASPALPEPDGIGGTAIPPTEIPRVRNRLKLRFSDWLVLSVVIGSLLYIPIADAIRSGLAMYIFGALVAAFLIYLAYRRAGDARRAQRSSGEAPIAATDPGPQAKSLLRSQVPGEESKTTFFDWFKRRKFGPLSASLAGIMAIVVLAVILLAKVVPEPRDSRRRELAWGNILEGLVLKQKVTEFYQKLGRLPQPSEAEAFQLAPPELQQTQSVVWDPAGRMIVITAGEPQPGKRFALHVEERSGVLHWTCRSIDFDPKYLPGSCR